MLTIEPGSDLAGIMAGYRDFAAERAESVARLTTASGKPMDRLAGLLCDADRIRRLDACGYGQGTRLRDDVFIGPSDA